MSRREDFSAVISAWDPQDIRALQIREREMELPPLNPGPIVTISGPRRAGKTYVMYLTMKKELERGVAPGNILYVNFEHERLRNLTGRDLESMVTAHNEIASPDPKKDSLLFLDEIQNVRGWGNWVRRTHDQGASRLYLSGSSSKLLSREISTELRGRSVDYLVFPFSFGEYLLAKGGGLPDLKRLPHLEDRGRLLAQLRQFLEVGGYPEVVLEGDRAVREKLLRSYYDTILYRDLVERFNVSSPAMMEEFVRLCVSSHAKYLSASKSYNYLRSLGFRTRKQTVLDYLRFAKESFVVIPLEIYSRSIKNRAQYPKKMYLVDNGLVHTTGFETSIGRLMENCALVELARRSSYFSDFQVYYWKEYGKSEGREVDFVIVKGGKVTQLLQVTYATSSKGVDSREVSALRMASEELGCKNSAVLTWDYRQSEEGGTNYLPLWEWLLRGDSTKPRSTR